MLSDKLQALEPTDEQDRQADQSDSDDDGTHRERQSQQRKRRRRAGADETDSAAQTGAKDHLFFSLKADPTDASTSSTLVIRGFSCTLHADSPLAAALRLESHLQFLDTAPPRVAVENADDHHTEEPLPTSLDKYDVRLIAPVAEWRQLNVDEERDDDLDEPAPEVVEEEDESALAAKVAAPFDPTSFELANERLTKEEFVQLHRERYADWWSALKSQPAASSEAAAPDTAMSDAAPSAPSMDRAIQEEEQATLDGQSRISAHSCRRVSVSCSVCVCPRQLDRRPCR